MRNWRPKKRRKLKRKPFRTTWCGKTDFCLGQLILVINQYWGQPRKGSRGERRSVLCWQLSHLGWTSFPPVSQLDYFYWITKPQGGRLKWPDQIAHQSYISVPGGHSEACEPRGENEEYSQHQEMAGGKTSRVRACWAVSFIAPTRPVGVLGLYFGTRYNRYKYSIK